MSGKYPQKEAMFSPLFSGLYDISLSCDDSQLYWIILAVSWLSVFCLLSGISLFLHIPLYI